MIYRTIFKPLFDVLSAACGLIILSPILISIALLSLVVNRENPFFTQVRTKKNGSLFKIIKFKSMNSKKDEKGTLLPDKDRLTKLGKFLRKTSLDEIPQLFNVLLGEMSIVGPRPLLPEYLPLYSEEQSRRHEVKPGITGWAQVNGRNAISWEEKFEKDVWYADHQSFKLDLKIVLLTTKKVFVREGINMDGEATTTHFKGSV